ncbi:MAG: UDP-2,3-diacylglucosamine diphosphatase [Acidiferrobacterales bacterium]|nr:UDP-2,3-diacylglucosamine diphosphatase [Acidiferrobacterales bacterium]
MSTLFISDLHLCAERPAITELFVKFLRTRALDADALYILGDLFEYWIGDEAVSRDDYSPVIAGMRALLETGTPIYAMHGNRDFLLGAEFERESGAKLLPDPSLIDLYGTPVLLMHGDSLCTDDVEYQAFRKMVRSEAWQRQYLVKSVAERDAISRRYRELSKNASANKRPEIMDVNQDAVETTMRQHHVYDLIHGHTHRPAQHYFELDGIRARRAVLGDWYEQGSVLRCAGDEWMLQTLPIAGPGRKMQPSEPA